MFIALLRLLVLGITLSLLPSCLIVCSTPIHGDAEADPALEGVWKITKKTSEEIQNDRDGADIGSARLSFKRLDPQTYEVIDYDKENDPTPMHFKVSSRKYKGNQFLIVHAATAVDTKEAKGGKEMKNAQAVVDYHVDNKGHLFLHYLHIEDLSDIEKTHHIKYEFGGQTFDPVILKGSEKQILELYTDPQVRVLLTSCGKYRKVSDHVK